MAEQDFGPHTPIVAPRAGRALPSGPTPINAVTGPSGTGTLTTPYDTPPAPIATTPTPNNNTDSNGLTPAEQTTLQSATAIVNSTLASLGLTGMGGWASSTMFQLAGQGMASGDIQNFVLNNLNNPTNADGSVNTTALNAFNTALPGYNQRIAETGNNGSPGASPAEAIAAYITYGTQIQQFAQQAGLTAGTITPADIGTLWSSNVSTNEVSQRITLATTDAQSVPQAVQDHLRTYYGVGPGDIASYYLNPTNTLNTLQTNFNSAVVGGAAATSGFGEINAAQAQTLQAFLASTSGGTSSGVGGINPLNFSSALNAFTSNLGDNGIGGSLGTAAQLSAYEGALPGQAGGGITQDTLLGAIEGNTTALQETQRAQQTRTASSRGGGGATTTAEGAVGLGYANS